MATDKSKFSPHDAKVTKTEEMPPTEARWIHLQKITYLDPTGSQRTWESAERSSRPSTSAGIDGVGVVAILSSPTLPPSLLLQKQFRPPCNAVTIEVPAGLLDENESPAECAIRELKEETGYIATIPTGGSKEAEGVLMWNDPGFCNTNTKMVFVDVDMTDERNQDGNRRPELEENEYIECFSVPLKGLWAELGRLEREEGYAIDARVGTLAQGIEIARRWGL